jgi:hypothetical protein
MKLILFFSIFLSFALIKEVSSNNNDPLMLVGFENYSNKNSNISFDILFKKYNNDDTYNTVYIGLNLFNNSASYTNYTNINCTNIEVTNDDELVYKCNFYSPNATVVQVKLINTSFIFYTHNETYNNTNIIESSLAKETKDNIISQTGELDISTFYFESFTQKNDDKVQINGRMVPNITGNINGNIYKLNLTKTIYDCTVDNNSITFNLANKNINENLIGKMLNLSNVPKILIFSNSSSSNDLLMYSTVKSSSIDLYGFENYTKPKDKNAENVVVFFGTPNILKKYVRFTYRIIYTNSTSLRLLEEKETNATGTIDPESTDLDNGVAKYKTIYENTENIQNILRIESLHDYKFSDDKDKFPSDPVTVYIVGDDINLTNAGILADYAFINFTDNPIIDGNTFSLKFKLKSQNTALNITNRQPAFLNYSSMETSQRDVIDSCSIENNTNILTINCEPKKDIYTLLNTLIIKIPNITQNRRLRFLQSSGNSTIRSPRTTSGDIQFEYNPEINTFARKASKKKGLSGGAIAAIVLATIAAVAAVAVAMLFLNRGPVNPIKTSNEMNLPNSTTNINN